MALDLVVRVFCNPGDVVLVEAPSYVGALGIFRAYECDVIHVPMDDQGLIPEALAETITRVRAQGKTIKMIYTIPSFHNPAGISQPAQRRKEVLELAQRENLLVLEDDPYALLGFDGTVPRAIRAEDSEQVVYLGSFSKTLASGLRVGWAVAPHGVREKLVLAAEAAVLCPSNFTQGVVSEFLATQPWRDQVEVFRGRVPRTPGRPAGVLGRPHAPGNHLDQTGGRLLLLADPARGSRRHRDAPARSQRPGGVRAGHGFLCGWSGPTQPAAVVLLPASQTVSARGYAGWRLSWSRRSRSVRRSAPRRRCTSHPAAPHRPPTLPERAHTMSTSVPHRPGPVRRTVARARRLDPIGPSDRRGHSRPGSGRDYCRRGRLAAAEASRLDPTASFPCCTGRPVRTVPWPTY